MRYRATCTVVYEVESDLPHEEIVKVIENELDDPLQVLGNTELLRRVVRLEKLRERRCSIHLGVFLPEDVLPYISREEMKREYIVGDKSYTVRMNSQRYFIFRESLCCAACGLLGTKMILEQNSADRAPHFNLYGEENGCLVLLTKDHVNPKAFGGVDRHSNFQTMCSICNNLKGHAKLTLESIAELRKLYNENRFLARKKLRVMLDSAKKRLAIPRTIPSINKISSKRLQAQLKAQEKEPLVSNTDIHIWKTTEGVLVGRSVYERELPGAVLVCSVKEGTELTPIRSHGTQVAVKLSESEEFLTYQGYVDYKENKKEDTCQN